MAAMNEKECVEAYLCGLHTRLGENSPVSLLDTPTAKKILKRITGTLAVKLESSWVPTPNAPEEHNTTTYLLRAGMFSNAHWSYLLSVLDLENTRLNIHEPPFPKVIGAIFLDALAGSDFDGCEVDTIPDITLVVDWKYERMFDSIHQLKRIRLVNKVRSFLGKHPYEEVY
jgi:hypothetical protein